MPFIPELFSFPALMRIEERRHARLTEVPFFDGLMTGEMDVDITNPVNATFDGLVVPPDGSATNELASLAGQILDVLIVGPQARARELEATGLLHMGVQDTLGTSFASALKIIARG